MGSKIKVVMLGPYLSEMGGVTAHIRNLTKYLSCRNDIELHLLTLGTKNEEYKKNNLQIHIIKKPFKYPLSILPITFHIRNKIIDIDPDILHAHGTFIPYSTVAAIMQTSYPAVLTVHGIASRAIKYATGTYYIYEKIFNIPNERYVLKRIPNIITVSPQARDALSRMTGSSIHIISNGVEFDNIQLIKPLRFEKKPVIFYIGGLHVIKGVDLLLKAIAIMKKTFPDILLNVAGSGCEEKNLRVLTKELGIEQSVTFLGHLYDDDKYQYYKAADICVIPSREENEPIVLLEAMSCGTAVIASDVGGISSILEDNVSGLLFSPCDVRDLAAKILTLLNDKDKRIKIGNAGLEKVRKFSWNEIANQTERLYRSILETHPPKV